MNVILLCPNQLPAGRLFQKQAPLALVPLFGRSALDRALESLSREGAGEVLVVSPDRPEKIRAAIESTSSWGLKIDCVAADRELDVEEAILKYHGEFESDAEVVVRKVEECLKPLAGLPGRVHFSNHQFFIDRLKEGSMPVHLTIREKAPGVWVSSRASIHPSATIESPVWIGPHVRIGPDVRIGADSIVENGSIVDRGAQIEGSWIGPDTYVGQRTEIVDSHVWGNTVCRWKDGSFIEIGDDFILADLKRDNWVPSVGWLSRVLAAGLLFTTSPLYAWWKVTRSKGEELFRFRRVVLPEVGSSRLPDRTVPLRTLEGVEGLASRWLELREVVRGRMSLVGNRPLTLDAISCLGGSRARKWMDHPAGVFSLGDAEGVDGNDPEVSIAYSLWFSSHNSLRIRLSVLRRCLVRLAGEILFSGHNSSTPEPASQQT